MDSKYLAIAAWLAAAGLVVPAGAQEKPQRASAVSKSVVVRTAGTSFLGVGVAEVDADRAKALNLKEEHGVEVKSVEPDSPASKAGIKESDVVLEYNGQRVEGVQQFIRLVRETPAGRQAKLLISRGGSTQTLTATIGSREGLGRIGEGIEISIPRIPEIRIPDVPRAFTSWRSPTLGIESESLGSQLAEFFGVKEGVLVRSVTKGSPAEKAGLKAGDVIIKVEDKRVAGPREISSLLRSLGSKKTLPVTVVRERKEMTLNIALDDDSSWWRERDRRRTLIRMDGYEL